MVSEGMEGDQMSRPREWSPRGSVEGTIKKIVEDLKNSNQSEPMAIADVLEGIEDDHEDPYGLALAILDEFTSAAEYARRILKKIGPR